MAGRPLGDEVTVEIKRIKGTSPGKPIGARRSGKEELLDGGRNTVGGVHVRNGQVGN